MGELVHFQISPENPGPKLKAATVSRFRGRLFSARAKEGPEEGYILASLLER